MNESVQENLLGLLMGSLEDNERRALEDQLETDADLRAEFARLRECIEPLDRGRVNYEPAAGLADRAFAFVQREVAVQEAELEAKQTRGPSKVQLTPVKEQVARRSWPLSDTIAAASILVVAFAMLLPALFASWESSNRLYCQANLREIGFALHDYAQQSPTQRLPEIPVNGNRSFAGIYAPVLVDAGYITNPRVFLCQSSNLAQSDVEWRMPKLSRVDQASQRDLMRMRRLAGGSYGYNLGYWHNGVYVSPSISDQDARYVWAADAPTWNVAGRISENHAGRGQNFLFADQHTDFVASCYIGATGDDAYRSDRGLVEAGVDRRDSVIGESHARPVTPPNGLPR